MSFNIIKVNNTDTGYTHSIFDISEYNSGAIYANLSTALAAVPQNKKQGGMSVKFIQVTPARYSVVKTENLETEPTGTLLSEAPYIDSGTYDENQLSTIFSTLPSEIGASHAVTYYVAVTIDETTTYTSWVIIKVQNSVNKYVQYRLMSASFSTNKAYWQNDTAEIIELRYKTVGLALNTTLLDYYFLVISGTYKIAPSYGHNMKCFFIPANISCKVEINSVNTIILGTGFTKVYPPSNGTECFNTSATTTSALNGTIIDAVNYDRSFCIGYNSSEEEDISVSLFAVNSIAYKLEDTISDVEELDTRLNTEIENINTRFSNIPDSSVKRLSDNSKDLLSPLSAFAGAATSSSKFGMYWENIISKNIVGMRLKSFTDSTLEYGVGTVTNNIVGNFVKVGQFAVTSGEHDYVFPTPVVLQENQVIYFQGSRTYGAIGNITNQNSFIDGYKGNDITKTNFIFSYYLIFSESLDTYLENNFSDIDERVDDLEENIGININYCAVGDSVTAGAYGEGWTQEDVDGLSYADYLQVLIGANQFVKRAVGGYSIYNNLNSLISSIGNDINLITICIGLNDLTLHFRNSVDIGDYVQIIKQAATTNFENSNINFYGDNILGRYRWCLEKVKSLHPSAKVVAISMPHERLTSQASIDVWNNIKYGECAICDYLSVPYLDFQSTSPIFTVHTDSTQPNWDDFLHDGCHPEKEGYHMMATAIYSLLKGLL